jgi:hypothetical protein
MSSGRNCLSSKSTPQQLFEIDKKISVIKLSEFVVADVLFDFGHTEIQMFSNVWSYNIFH